MAEIIEGNLLTCDAKYVVHQCNCVSIKPRTLAEVIFNKYPYSDIYTNRKFRDNPGHIIVRGNGTTQRYIIAMLSQFYPGKPKYRNDKAYLRRFWFKKCLEEIAALGPNLESVAFPYNIGCDAAGGKWDEYKRMIDEFAQKVGSNGTKVYIIKLSQSEQDKYEAEQQEIWDREEREEREEKEQKQRKSKNKP